MHYDVALLGAPVFTCLQLHSLEKELEQHRKHKPKSGMSECTAVSGQGWDRGEVRVRNVNGGGVLVRGEAEDVRK